jgi:UDP-N-acetylmuramate--alanine ligase
MKTALGEYKYIYFIGIGGIGMSAIARYFNLMGLRVCGYDKTPSPLTNELENEGIDIHFSDMAKEVESKVGSTADTLVIYTPAIPKEHGELTWLKEKGYKVIKRAEALGVITHFSRGLAVAGTHGKTTTSTMLAHLLHETVGCNAFLGGISSNYNTNYLSSTNSPFTVIEADEFDRSFLQLSPYASIITATDADHLDIYGTPENFQKGFEDYAMKIQENGFLILRKGIELQSKAKTFSYAIEEDADYKGYNLRYVNGVFMFDIQTPSSTHQDVVLGLPGKHNAENALACFAMCDLLKFDLTKIIEALATFKGVKRRFEYHIKTQNIIYIDDYAHHPTELNALIDSVQLLYPGKTKIGVFQPHLFTRTRDFIDGFAEQLSRLDEVILLPIYPARELPITGITSELVLSKMINNNKRVLTKEETVQYLKTIHEGVVLTIGAGDIDRLVPEIKMNFVQK